MDTEWQYVVSSLPCLSTPEERAFGTDRKKLTGLQFVFQRFAVL
jgi:hypothetical protein